MSEDNENFQIIAIDISGPLKIKTEDIGKYLLISIGDRIEEDTVLARKKSFLGVDRIEIRSPVEGLVDNIDTDKGLILVKVYGDKDEENEEELVKEDDNREVKEDITDDKEVEIEINKKSKDKEVKKIGKGIKVKGIESFGDGQGLGWKIEGELNTAKIIPLMKGKIILAENLPSIKDFYKASAIGIEGIVVQDFDKNKATEIKNEMVNKTHVGFLLIDNDIDLKALHNRRIKISDGILEVE